MSLSHNPTARHWIVVMGVAGSGKSTFGESLAGRLDLPFIEGDRFHSAASVAKMQAGMPLTDDDRSEWLDRLGTQLRSQVEGAVLTCSALKNAYRRRLTQSVPTLRFVYLNIDAELAMLRVGSRVGHVFPKSLVASQFATLEPPAASSTVLWLAAADSPEVQISRALEWLQSPSSEGSPGSDE
jgi:gluconokinase